MNFDNGLITELSANGISIGFADDIIVCADRETHTFSSMECLKDGPEYVFKGIDAEFTVAYREVDCTAFVARSITAKFDDDTVLSKISVKLPKAEEQFMYETFYNASAAVFSRNKNIGF